ncbi:MAG TPA: hypothetical protein VG675_11260 [Bryobacteraceae bacterium]|nr:hypothetical protein [Bryobacteraceae bacterium]
MKDLLLAFKYVQQPGKIITDLNSTSHAVSGWAVNVAFAGFRIRLPI